VLDEGSVSLRRDTARLYLAQLALLRSLFEPTTVCESYNLSGITRINVNRDTYVMNGGVTRMDSVSTMVTPRIYFVLVDDGISALEVRGIHKQGIVLVRDKVARYSLLDDGLTPVVIEPRQSSFLLTCCGTEKGIFQPRDVKIDLGKGYFVRSGLQSSLRIYFIIDHMVVNRAH
jgi:hypothetical protein